MQSPVHKSSFAGRLREALEFRKPDFDRRPRFRKAPFLVTSGTDLSHIFNEGYEGSHIRAATAQFWINGEHLPRRKNLKQLLAVLDVAEEWLLYGTPPGPIEIRYQQAGTALQDEAWPSLPEAHDAEDDMALMWVRFYRALNEITVIGNTLHSYGSRDPNKKRPA
jgi:hypothetical protein